MKWSCKLQQGRLPDGCSNTFIGDKYVYDSLWNTYTVSLQSEGRATFTDSPTRHNIFNIFTTQGWPLSRTVMVTEAKGHGIKMTLFGPWDMHALRIGKTFRRINMISIRCVHSLSFVFILSFVWFRLCPFKILHVWDFAKLNENSSVAKMCVCFLIFKHEQAFGPSGISFDRGPRTCFELPLQKIGFFHAFTNVRDP